MSDRIGGFPRGQTKTQIADDELGMVKEFADLDLDNDQARLSGHPVKCMLVLNDSSSTLNPGEVVKFKDAYWGKRIGAVAGDGEVGDGIVDEYVSSVADDSYCWIVRLGPTEAINDGNGSIDQGDFVQCAASGEVDEDSGTPVSNACFGRALEDVAASNVKFRVFADFEGPR